MKWKEEKSRKERVANNDSSRSKRLARGQRIIRIIVIIAFFVVLWTKRTQRIMNEEEMWTNISLMCVFFSRFVWENKNMYYWEAFEWFSLQFQNDCMHRCERLIVLVLPHNFGRLLMPLGPIEPCIRVCVCVGQIVRALLTIIDVFNEIFIWAFLLYGATSARQDCKQTLVYWIGLCVGWSSSLRSFLLHSNDSFSADVCTSSRSGHASVSVEFHFIFTMFFKSIHIFLWRSRFCAWCIQNSCMLIPYARLLFKLRSSSYINWCNSLLIKCYTQQLKSNCISVHSFAVCICCLKWLLPIAWAFVRFFFLIFFRFVGSLCWRQQ